MSVVAASTVCAFAQVTSTPTYVPPRACAYTCPDKTCAGFLADCACVASARLSGANASFARSLAAFDVAKPLTAVAYAEYGVPSGNCSSYDFKPFITYSWVLGDGSGVDVFTSSSSVLSVPALQVAPAATYTLTLTVRGLLASATMSVSWVVATIAPQPVVSIAANGAALRVSNDSATVLTAAVTDPFPGDTPAFSWACIAVPPTQSTACPTFVNATVARAVVPAGSLAGLFTIVFTYRGVSSRLNLTVVAEAIPVVRIQQLSVPVTTVPALYLPSQAVILASTVTGVANVTLQWSVNGVAMGSGRSFAVNATSLTASSALQLASNTPVQNTIVLRASSIVDPTVYGETSIVVVVAPTYSLSLALSKLTDGVATSATGLADTLKLDVTSDLDASEPYNLAATYAFQFVADAVRPLNVAPTGAATTFTAVAPMPFSATAATGSPVSVTFMVQLLLGGKVVSSAAASFLIVKPDPAAAAAIQISQATAITDPSAAVAAATNLETLMQSSSDPNTTKALAAAAVNMLANSVSDFGSQSTAQQAAIFETLSTAVNVNPDAALKAKTLVLMTNALASDSFDPANGGSALTVLGLVGAKDSAAVIAQLAVRMANDATQEVGSVRTLSASGVRIAVVKQSASDMAGMNVSDGSTSLSLGAGFALPGVQAGSVVSIAQSSFATNTLGTNRGVDPTTGVVSIQFNVDSSTFAVAGLTVPIEFVMLGAPPTARCYYWKTATAAWAEDGLTSTPVAEGVRCSTTHLTSFGTFVSTSSRAVLHLVAAIALILVQALV